MSSTTFSYSADDHFISAMITRLACIIILEYMQTNTIGKYGCITMKGNSAVKTDPSYNCFSVNSIVVTFSSLGSIY